MAREGVPLIVIQRQLGHTNLGITSIYLQGKRSSATFASEFHALRRAAASALPWRAGCSSSSKSALRHEAPYDRAG